MSPASAKPRRVGGLAEPARGRPRDAGRTRATVLDAAEQLFARRGYEAASLGDIATAAGVSRGTPSYFFGSKEELCTAVIERIFEERNRRLGPAFATLAEWAASEDPEHALEEVLTAAVSSYIEFLRDRPAFVEIVEREALCGGRRLRGLRHQSTVMEDAFDALARNARVRGLREFEAAEAVMALIGLAYLPVAHRDTILARHGLSPDDEAFLARRVEHIVDVLLHVVGAPRALA